MRLKHTERTAAGNGGMPVPGRWIAAEQGDRARWLQTSEYTPVNVSRILEAANEGDIAELAVAAREIQERNWEVILAMQVRKSALTGLDWGVEPGDERPASKDAALAFEAALTVLVTKISVTPTTFMIPRTSINTSPKYFSSSPSVQSPNTFVVSNDFISLLATKNSATSSKTIGLPAGVETTLRGLPQSLLIFSISPRNKRAVKGSAETPTTDA